MVIGKVVLHQCTQAVLLPNEARLPDGVREVEVQIRGGAARIIAPVGHSWDSFFLDGPTVSHDFMAERASHCPP